MKLILKKDVQALGEAGDIVEVKDGFARNFLLPSNTAEVATTGAIKNREKNIATIKAKAEKLKEEAKAKADQISAIGVLQIQAKAGENGKLFGAVTTKKLAEVILEKSGIEVDKRNISLDNPINHLGDYKLNIKLTSKVEVNLAIKVIASEVIKEVKVEEVVEEIAE